MAVRTPLKLDGSNDLREMSTDEIELIQAEAARLYGLNPSVTLSVVASGGNLGTISDTRLEAGAGSSSVSAVPSQATTDDVSTITVNYSKLNSSVDTSEADWTNSTYSYPLYYDNGDLREMSPADFGDTFIKPAIDNITATSSNPGTYFISTTAGGIAGSTLVSTTPVFQDTRYNDPGIGNNVNIAYEIIGGGGSGGNGWQNTSATSGGSSSTLSGSGFTTITSAGGAAGGSHYLWAATSGQASYYGPGGAAGATSDSSRQTSGSPAPSTSYGAGGGGGGGRPFSAYNSGAGGTAAVRHAGNLLVADGTQLTIVIGAGGSGGTGSLTLGGAGAGGYAKITVSGTVYEYTSPGTYTLTVNGAPAADLFYPEDDPITISSYYLYKKDASPTAEEIQLPICYTKTGINLQQIPEATMQDALETMIRYYAAEVTGTKISYNINGAGTTQGTAMTDTKLDGSTYYTEYEGVDSYKAQEIPTGTATTISTYNLKITQT